MASANACLAIVLYRTCSQTLLNRSQRDMEVISMGSGDSVNGMPYEGPVTAGKVYICSRCSHRWVARKKGGLPKNCPKCRSTVWMKDYHICKCYRCNHKWGTVNEEPKRCPKCHSTKWAVPVKTGESSPQGEVGLPQHDRSRPDEGSRKEICGGRVLYRHRHSDRYKFQRRLRHREEPLCRGPHPRLRD